MKIKAKNQSALGFSLIEVMIAVALLGATAFAVVSLMNIEFKSIAESRKRGEFEDLRRWARASLDCRQTVRLERSLCTTAGNKIRGYNRTGNALIANRIEGRNFRDLNVKLQCNDSGLDFTINGQVASGGTAQNLFEVPISCKKCGAGTTDPQTFVTNSPHALKSFVVNAAFECGDVIPNYEFRRSYNAAGNGGNRWPNDGTMDLLTLDKICDILGFDNYVSSTCLDGERSGRYPSGKCNWHSPGDNHLQYFNGANWIVQRGPPKYDWTWVSSITCSGLR